MSLKLKIEVVILQLYGTTCMRPSLKLSEYNRFCASNDSYNSSVLILLSTFTPNMFIDGIIDKKFTSNYLIYKSQRHIYRIKKNTFPWILVNRGGSYGFS
jgi:hypothetical protein